MDFYHGEFLFSDDKSLIQADRAYEMLLKTYWADKRTKEAVRVAIENSLCFGIYKDGVQVGLARTVTDYGVLYYLCDVVIDESYRGQGLGKALMKAILEHEKLESLLGLLATDDAHSLYEKFGFHRDTRGTAMRKPAPDSKILAGEPRNGGRGEAI